jgi:hypothetical protein
MGHVARWTEHRIQLPIGPLFGVLAGPTRGHGLSATAARGELRRLAAQAGVRRRVRAAPLCRPDGYADLVEKVRARWDVGWVDVGITRVVVVILP